MRLVSVGSVTNGYRRGKRRKYGTLRGALIRFEVDTFAEIRALALRDKVSFSEQVRCLVEWGLEEERKHT